MSTSKRITIAAIAAVLMPTLFIFSGCAKPPENTSKNEETPRFASFKDIPGVSEDEKAAIEALRKKYASFVYRVTPSTEAFAKENGEVGGYAALLCGYLTALFNIRFEPMLTEGTTDFTGEMEPTGERRKSLLMTEKPIARRHLAIVRLEGSQAITQIEKKRIPRYAFLKDSATIEKVASVLAPGSYEAVTIESGEWRQSLKSGRADGLVVVNTEQGAFDAHDDLVIEPFYPLVSLPVSLTTEKPELAPIISIMDKALKNGEMKYLIDVYDRGYNEYKKNNFFTLLTQEEREYIKNNPTVQIAAVNWFYPVCFYNKYENRWEGIGFDAFDEVTKITGMNFKLGVEPDMPWAEIYEKMESGKIPTYFALIYTADRAERYVWSEHKYITENYALISKQSFPDISINKIPYARIGLMKDMGYTVMFNKWFPDATNTTMYATQNDAFRALDEGEIDLLMTGTNTLLSITHYYEYSDYKANFVFDSTIVYSSAFNRNEPILYSVIEKALKFADVQKITKRWESRTYDYQKKLLKAQRPWLIGVSVLSLIVLALVTTFLIRSRKAGVHLNKLVNEKTGKLEETANELALQKTTLYTIIDSIPDHIFCLDVNMNFTLLNKALVEFFKLETTAIGKNISDALKFPDELKNCINAMGYAVISSGKEATMELPVPSHDKSERVFEIVQVPFIQDSVILGVVGIAHDITALKEMQEAALAASRSKSTFLANMSHEIRTPMNAILGITEIQLQNATVEGGVKEALERIYTSGDMLLGIINDILDLSRIESGKLELSVGEYEIASLISDAVQVNMIRIGSKPIEFDLRIDENTPVIVAGDELRVKQILNNLLSNAFKYTKAGLVELSISAEKTVDTHDAVMMVFSVSDTGQGMTEEQVSKLFDEYSRFNVEANRKTEGAGLGMSITRNLVLLMGGEISVESESGKGSVFTVRLPQGRIGSAVLDKEMTENLRLFRTSSRAQMKRSQITREPMPYGSVMVVDDVETNIYVAKGILAPYGLRIDSADSGFAAIEKIQNGQVYDIVFMDHMMPEMDGIETTKKIRGMGYEHPIIALTANAVVGQAEIFLGNGFDDFISKPIDMRLMNVVLNKFVRDRHPPEVVEAARRQQDAAHEAIADEGPQASLDPQLAKIFIRDASMSIAVVEALCRKQDAYRDEDIRAYVVNIHGIKSALANIGDMKLAALASKLEQAGRDRDTAVMSSETPALLNALREIIERIAPKEENAANESTDEDRSYLREKLLALQAACTMYNKKVAKDVLSELEHKAWSRPTKELLDTLARELLHSKFKRIASAVDKALHDA